MSFERAGTVRRLWPDRGLAAVAAAMATCTVAVGAAAAASPDRGGGASALIPAAVVMTRGHFKTPSGNIFCAYFRNAGAVVECVMRSEYEPLLPRRRPGCSRSYWIELSATGRLRTGGSVCPGEPDPEGPFIGAEQAWVLGYGKTWSGGGVRCTSAMSGLTCRNKSGHGCFLSREHWRAF
jgi:hypothetical protein